MANMQTVRVLVAFAVLLAVAGCSRRQFTPAETACLSVATSIEGRGEIVRESIKTLDVDGKARSVAKEICVIYEDFENGPTWFRVDRASQSVDRANIVSQSVRRFAASPDGKFLAVEKPSEALSYVEIINLPHLIQEGRYTVVGLIGGFPGTASIKEWDGGKLLVTSDILVSHPRVDNRPLDLFGHETFSWDGQTGTVAPVSKALENLVDYYCARAMDPHSGTRYAAQEGLMMLRDKKAIPCLEKALAAESDPRLRPDLQRGLENIRKQ